MLVVKFLNGVCFHPKLRKCFVLQDEKQQILTTNVWLEQVNMTDQFMDLKTPA